MRFRFDLSLFRNKSNTLRFNFKTNKTIYFSEYACFSLTSACLLKKFINFAKL